MKMLKAKLLERKRRNRLKSDKRRAERHSLGNQIRSYVFLSYTLMKDHRTNYEKEMCKVMDGDRSVHSNIA